MDADKAAVIPCGGRKCCCEGLDCLHQEDQILNKVIVQQLLVRLGRWIVSEVVEVQLELR
jgi:hypothetical protein